MQHEKGHDDLRSLELLGCNQFLIDNQLRLRAIDSIDETASEAPRLFSQAEVDKKVKAALGGNNSFWIDTQRRERENSPPSLTAKQVDGLVAAAVAREEGKWLAVVDSNKRRHESDMETLKANHDDELEKFRASTKAQIEAVWQARFDEQANVCRTGCERHTHIWQTRFDEQAEALVMTKEEIESCSREIEMLQQAVDSRVAALNEETQEVVKYKSFLTQSCDISNDHYRQFRRDYDALHNDLEDTMSQLDEQGSKYVNLELRYSMLTKERNEDALHYARQLEALEEEHARQLDALENELEDTRASLEEVRKAQKNIPKFSEHASKSPFVHQPADLQPQSCTTTKHESSTFNFGSSFKETTFGQQDATAADDGTRTASQQAFVASMRAAQQSSQENAEAPKTLFGGLPKSFSNVNAGQSRSAEGPEPSNSQHRQ